MHFNLDNQIIDAKKTERNTKNNYFDDDLLSLSTLGNIY